MFQVFFFYIKSWNILCKNPFNFFFYKITKMKIKSFECSKSIKNYEKKILGMSEACLMSRFSHRPSKPAYYIVDLRTCFSIDRAKAEIFTNLLFINTLVTVLMYVWKSLDITKGQKISKADLVSSILPKTNEKSLFLVSSFLSTRKRQLALLVIVFFVAH